MHHPGLSIVGDERLPRRMRRVLHAHLCADLEGFVNPFQHALARHLQGASDLADGLAGMVAPQDLRALDITESGGLGLSKLIEMILLFLSKNELRMCRWPWHAPSITRTRLN